LPWWGQDHYILLCVGNVVLHGIFNLGVENVASRILGLPETEARVAFHELVDTLVSFDTTYMSPQRQPMQSNDELAEGYRLALALLSIGTDFYMEQDPAHPEFKQLVTPSRKIMGDNPDALYYFVPISPSFDYIIRGARAGEVYLSLTVYGGLAQGGFASSVDADLNFKNITFAEDGTFEVFISTKPRPADNFRSNWMQMSNSAASIVTRHCFEHPLSAAVDPSVRVNVSISLAESHAPPSSPLADSEVASRLRAVKHFVDAHSTGMPPQDPTKAPGWFSMQLNTIGKPAVWASDKQDGGMGAVDIAYAAGYFRLERGEVLLMRGRLPSCVFGNVVLWNRLLQTFDYRSRQISLNRKQMKSLNGDMFGEFKIALSAADPQLSDVDRLDAGDRKGGIIFWRFVLPEGEMFAPTTKLVPAEVPLEQWIWPDAPPREG